MFCCSRYLTGVHTLQEGISYRMICCTGEHLLYKDKFNWMVCPIGSQVLHEGMSYRWICLAGVPVIQVVIYCSKI